MPQQQHVQSDDSKAHLAGMRRREEPHEDDEGSRPVSRQHLPGAAGYVLDRTDVYAARLPGGAIRAETAETRLPICPATYCLSILI